MKLKKKENEMTISNRTEETRSLLKILKSKVYKQIAADYFLSLLSSFNVVRVVFAAIVVTVVKLVGCWYRTLIL